LKTTSNTLIDLEIHREEEKAKTKEQNKMTKAELQAALLFHLSEQGITPQEIKDMKSEDSPYPINGKYIWYLTKGIVKGRHTPASNG
jgi:type II secretory pathway component PulF